MILQLLSIASVLAGEAYIYDKIEYIYTPNGSPVKCGVYSGNVNDYLGVYDYLHSDIPVIAQLARSNPIYNCFSYAFYQQSSNNNHVLLEVEDVEQYWEDGSYVFSTGMTGDIIVYFDGEGNPMHAGVVLARTGWPALEGTDDLSKIIVESKWDQGPLYRHMAISCPYSHIYNPFYGDYKYYRLNSNHIHDYTFEVNNIDASNHLAVCSCGKSIKQPHLYHHTSDNGYVCTYCNAVDTVGITTRKNSSDLDETYSFKGNIYLSDDDYLSLINN